MEGIMKADQSPASVLSCDRLIQDALTELNQRESPLLRLRAELRDKIYKYVICGDTERTLQVHRYNLYEQKSTENKPCEEEASYKPHLALLQVSRQTHQETVKLSVSRHTFFIVRQPDRTRFFHCLTEVQKAAIESIKLEFVWYDPEQDDFKLWFWVVDVWYGFDGTTFRFLQSLTGLRTVHIDIVSIWSQPASSENYAQAEEIVYDLSSQLKAQLAEGVTVQIHHLLIPERNGSRAQSEFDSNDL